ncbi:hypothetical protein [Mycobacterium marinum]|uniref:hypothetical protein n=1 Tax=Mycobacterium marinum TaxID=1781 RepID=UPI003569FCE7
MTESHFPGWHYAEAERLLGQVGEMDPGLHVTQTFIARAQAHATLAQCRRPRRLPEVRDADVMGNRL